MNKNKPLNLTSKISVTSNSGNVPFFCLDEFEEEKKEDEEDE